MFGGQRERRQAHPASLGNGVLALLLPQPITRAKSETLLKINQGLPPATQQTLDELIAKRQTQTLTPEEPQELIRLTASIEKVDAEQLQDLLELAALRTSR